MKPKFPRALYWTFSCDDRTAGGGTWRVSK